MKICWLELCAWSFSNLLAADIEHQEVRGRSGHRLSAGGSICKLIVFEEGARVIQLPGGAKALKEFYASAISFAALGLG